MICPDCGGKKYRRNPSRHLRRNSGGTRAGGVSHEGHPGRKCSMCRRESTVSSPLLFRHDIRTKHPKLELVIHLYDPVLRNSMEVSRIVGVSRETVVRWVSEKRQPSLAWQHHLLRQQDLCGKCYIKQRRYLPGLTCNICNIKSGGDHPFSTITDEPVCIKCSARISSGAVRGRHCKSCWFTDADYAALGKTYGAGVSRCMRCKGLEQTRKRKGWRPLCPSKQHVMPPPGSALNPNASLHKQPRDFPACDCYIDEETGEVVPDPQPRIIPIEDEIDPSRGYIPLGERFRRLEQFRRDLRRNKKYRRNMDESLD